MRNFLKLPILILLALFLILGPVLVFPARGAEAPTRYDAFTEGIVSSYYHIDREQGFIIGVAPGTAAEHLLKVCLPGNGTVSQERLATGTTLNVTSTTATEEPETKTHTLTVIVTGDLNGDGNVTITDMLMIKSAILGESLSAPAGAAADINYDGKITITDFLKVKSCLLGREEIVAGRPSGTTPADPLILTVPETSDSWSVPGAVAYTTDDETLAAIDGSGTITTGSREGSTFVYALDEQGNVLARSIVTVLTEKLTVFLDATSHRLVPGQTVTLGTRFNHPVTVPISWSSSDPAVAEVDTAGKVTAKGLGTVTITATLPNGSTATATISVVPPVKSITFDRTLYKIKPGSSRTLGITLTPGDTGEELIWSSSNTSIATVSSDGTVTGVSKGTTTITVKGKYSGLSASCSVKICDVKQVAITFDDGPSNQTAALLDYLQQSGIKVTFFMVGNRLDPYSETLKRIVAGGHEIGYHSYAHALQSTLSSEQITKDFNESNKILKELTGAQFTVWRAPGGDYNERILKCIPLPHIGWNVDTLDWETQSSESNYRAIIKAKDGAIILLHDLYAPSVNGAIKAMKEMIAGDYEFMTVTELLGRNGTPPQKHTHYDKG
jgi:peptidoglycan/xylan/chitin deacetylase (PgdA/CDA1 family)